MKKKEIMLSVFEGSCYTNYILNLLVNQFVSFIKISLPTFHAKLDSDI